MQNLWIWKVSDHWLHIQHFCTSNDEFIFLKGRYRPYDELRSPQVVVGESGDIPDDEELKSWDDISTDPRRKHLHIIVKRPAGRHLLTVVEYSLLTWPNPPLRPDTDPVKLDYERSFGEEEGDIIIEMVNSTCDYHASPLFFSFLSSRV